jgi:creatinine amidohydrolase/Fe(II)-dependent formamide hydrolase-like protein
MVYSMGAFNEAHSPALPLDIDDHMARRTAVEVCQKLGSYYKAHLPYCGDIVGELARDWCQSHMDSEHVFSNVIADVKRDIEAQNQILSQTISHVVIISCHGGNNILQEKQAALSESAGIPVLYIPPFDGIIESYGNYTDIRMTHADIAEHSIADYLGLLDRKKLDVINELASKDPEAALKKWPTIAGLGGYRLFGGERYEPLRKSRSDPTAAAIRFISERKMIVDVNLGKRFYLSNLTKIEKRILEFVKDPK